MKNITLVIVVIVVAIVIFAATPTSQAQQAKKFDDYFEKQYGALGKTTEEILSHENATNSITVYYALHWRIGQKAVPRLTDTERKLLAARWLESEVNCGGFEQYFSNSEGDNAELALTSLKEMDATNTATVLERAMGVFPNGKPPANRFKRHVVMQQIDAQSKPVWKKCDSEFDGCKESIINLSLDYAKKKRADIVLP